MENDQIFVERKTHREDWTGEKSVKARFPMKEKHVNAYLSGRMTAEAVFEKMRKEGKKSEQQIADWEAWRRRFNTEPSPETSNPWSERFTTEPHFSCPETLVFASPGYELSMIREDTWMVDAVRATTAPNDIVSTGPSRKLPPEDIERFPTPFRGEAANAGRSRAPQWIEISPPVTWWKPSPSSANFYTVAQPYFLTGSICSVLVPPDGCGHPQAGHAAIMASNDRTKHEYIDHRSRGRTRNPRMRCSRGPQNGVSTDHGVTTMRSPITDGRNASGNASERTGY